MMPLGMVEIGESGVIGKITGQDEVRQHLAGLGFVGGSGDQRLSLHFH